MVNLSNKTQLIGHLGKDVEFQTLQSGKKLAKVTIATKEIYKKDGEKIIETQWHNLVGWGRIAENMNTLFKKGKNVAIQGKLIHRTFEDSNGQKKYFSEVVVSDFMLMG